MFPFPIILAHHMEDCGNMLLHDQGSKHSAKLEQHTFAALGSLDFFNEDMYFHPRVPLLSCTQLLGLECRFLEDGMSIVLNHAM